MVIGGMCLAISEAVPFLALRTFVDIMICLFWIAMVKKKRKEGKEGGRKERRKEGRKIRLRGRIEHTEMMTDFSGKYSSLKKFV